MISSVVVAGYLGKKMSGGYRIVKTKFKDALEPFKCVVSEIPVLNWTRDEKNYLNDMEEGTFVVIKGHLEKVDKIGIYIVAETIDRN